MRALDGLAKRNSQRFGVVARKSAQQIVQRIHDALLATGFTRPPAELPVAKFAAEYDRPISPRQKDVDLVGQKNDFTSARQKSFFRRRRLGGRRAGDQNVARLRPQSRNACGISKATPRRDSASMGSMSLYVKTVTSLIGPLSPESVPDAPEQSGAAESDLPGDVEWNGVDRRDRKVDLGRLAAGQTLRELLSHRGRERDAAAVAAEIGEQAGRGFMDMRIVI